jgi:hypothetical protein
MSIRINCFLDKIGNKIYPGDKTGCIGDEFKIIDIYKGMIFIFCDRSCIVIRSQSSFIGADHKLFKKGKVDKEKIKKFREFVNEKNLINLQKFSKGFLNDSLRRVIDNIDCRQYVN